MSRVLQKGGDEQVSRRLDIVLFVHGGEHGMDVCGHRVDRGLPRELRNGVCRIDFRARVSWDGDDGGWHEPENSVLSVQGGLLKGVVGQVRNVRQ